MFKHVKLNESVLPKSLGVKGKNHDGVNMPSVTSILGDIPERKEKIIQWRKAVGEQMANYISVTSTNRGKSTHKLIENHLNNEDDKSNGVTNVVALGLFRLIKPYLARLDNIHCLEEYLYSKEIGVAGQVDCVAEYKGKLSIVDFKTSTKRRDADYNYGNFLQCSAYAKKFEEMYPDKKIEQTVVLATCESGEVQEWIHGEDKIKEHQELFYKHTAEFLERHKSKLSEIA